VLVPFAWDYTVLDLAQACDLDAIIVARPGLGTLNHAAMTAMILRARGIAIRGVVLNGRATSPDLAESTNPAALSRMLRDIRIVEVPHQTAGDPVHGAATIVDRLL
jgi:dethiobiotin synthetase